jgi:NAD(P)H-nitrite reductase large subunit
MSVKTKYLIIGVNAAGFYALEALRKYDSYGSITAVNGEEYFPYKRTKINKNFNSDKLKIEKFMLAEPEWYVKNRITLLNNTIIRSIDTSKKTALMDGDEIIEWDKLLLSTGAEARCPSSDLFKKAFSIRNFDDAKKILNHIDSSKSCFIYGLGIEGIETAARLQEAGLKVTLAGRGDILLRRYFSSNIRRKIEKQFLNRDVSIFYNTGTEDIHSLIKENNESISKDNSSSILSRADEMDFLLYSIGIEPRKNLALACGIKTAQGILVNSRMETSATDIYAAGDCTQLESGTITDHWHAAQDQGRTAAANMAGHFSAWPVKKYRIKLDLFGEFYFSMRPFIENVPDDMEVEESILAEGIYRLFYYENDILKGLEMSGDKTRAKLYKQAVNEAWSRSLVDKQLG